ncbi:MAG TPA: kynureninase [Thermoanaerobaculia bacterium]|nr:kynureninase [Thermoanaerobaculia bacterium]
MREDDLYRSPNALAPLYSRFRVGERLLLTGHSHQAWPDRALDGQIRAFTDAAEQVDAKWERAFAQADRVRRGFAHLMEDDTGDDVALAGNTHELVVRFLSALPLARRRRLVTTDGEFHSIRRQLDRLAEEGIEVVKVPAHPVDAVAGRLVQAVDDRTAAVLVSAVFFGSGAIVPGLDQVCRAARAAGAEILIDVYHALGVLPFPVAQLGLGEAFVVGGGYKYCQLGEGNCFLRLPAGCALRPVVTGWFAEFDALASARPGEVAYGPGGVRFAGSTYDPTSHYRAAEVFDFWAEQGLTPSFLRAVSQHQVGLLARGFDDLDLSPALIDRDRSLPLEQTGGFLALRSPQARALSEGLRERGVSTDYRNDVLRLGPAPYLSDAQLRDALGLLGEVARQVEGSR